MPSKGLLRPGQRWPRRGACRAPRRRCKGGRRRRPPRSPGATRSSTTSTTRRSCRGSRAAGSSSCAATAAWPASAVWRRRGNAARPRRAVMLATGTTALIPPVAGAAEAEPWTNRHTTTAKAAPERLSSSAAGRSAGDGPGLPLVRRQRRAGRGGRTCSGARSPTRRAAARGARGRGIEVHTGVKATAVRRPEGETTVELDDGTVLAATSCCARSAAGRSPTTSASSRSGWRPAGDRGRRPMRVPGDWLYVLGDVNGRMLLTHMGKYQARIAADVILGVDARSARRRALAAGDVHRAAGRRGGLHARQRAGGRDRRVCLEAETSGNAGGSFYGRTRRAPRGWSSTRQRPILGATMVGAEVADFLHAATIAAGSDDGPPGTRSRRSPAAARCGST